MTAAAKAVPTEPLSLTVNGRAVDPIDAPADLSMQNLLHEYLGLTGARLGCGQGVCNACAVLVEEPDGSLSEIQTCITDARWFQDKRVRTIEGHATHDAEGNLVALSPVQQAFIEHFAFQCGYCTPGFVAGATAFLDGLKRNPVARAKLEGAIADALDRHICRCTGYVRYYEAVRDLALRTPGLVTG